MNEELDSQLSAMFDNELPAAECELLARRLSRDEELKARWSRYAAIGATIRAEGGVRLNSNLAVRVNNAISAEPAVVVAKAIEPIRETIAQGHPTLADAAGRSRSGCQRRCRLDPVPEVRVTDAAGCAVACL